MRRAAILFTDYERLGEPLATRIVFLRRLGNNLLWAFGLIGVSLAVGMLGYRYIEHHTWLDAYDQAAMILSGMGPYNEPVTPWGKFFAGTYALYSGLVVVATIGLILSPVFHRLMHGLHVADDSDGGSDPPDVTPLGGKGKKGGSSADRRLAHRGRLE